MQCSFIAIFYPLVNKLMGFKSDLVWWGQLSKHCLQKSSYTCVHVLIFLYAVTDGE